jgi:hypothetical protein
MWHRILQEQMPQYIFFATSGSKWKETHGSKNIKMKLQHSAISNS